MKNKSQGEVFYIIYLLFFPKQKTKQETKMKCRQNPIKTWSKSSKGSILWKFANAGVKTATMKEREPNITINSTFSRKNTKNNGNNIIALRVP